LAFVALLGLPALRLVLPRQVGSLFSLTCGPVIFAACIGGVLIYLIEVPECFVGKILNLRIVRHVGVISYSVYLWQQVFTSDVIPMLPAGFLLAFLAAEFSYWAVERPSLRLRSYWESKMA
jgi:peptidoglycan/LPS O-acetylase OafA/YrhL